MADEEVSVLITAIDRASEVFRSISKVSTESAEQISQSYTKSMSATRKVISELGDTIDKTTNLVRQFGTTVISISEVPLNVARSMHEVTAAGKDMADTLGETAKIAGLTYTAWKIGVPVVDAAALAYRGLSAGAMMAVDATQIVIAGVKLGAEAAFTPLGVAIGVATLAYKAYSGVLDSVARSQAEVNLQIDSTNYEAAAKKYAQLALELETFRIRGTVGFQDFVTKSKEEASSFFDTLGRVEAGIADWIGAQLPGQLGESLQAWRNYYREIDLAAQASLFSQKNAVAVGLMEQAQLVTDAQRQVAQFMGRRGETTTAAGRQGATRQVLDALGTEYGAKDDLLSLREDATRQAMNNPANIGKQDLLAQDLIGLSLQRKRLREDESEAERQLLLQDTTFRKAEEEKQLLQSVAGWTAYANEQIGLNDKVQGDENKNLDELAKGTATMEQNAIAGWVSYADEMIANNERAQKFENDGLEELVKGTEKAQDLEIAGWVAYADERIALDEKAARYEADNVAAKIKKEEAAALSIENIIKDTFAGVSTGISGSIRGVIQGTQTLEDAFKHTGENIALGLVDSIITRGLKKVEDALIDMLPSISTIGSSIASAASWAWNAISFSEGGVVPGRDPRDTIPAMLRPGEMVLKPELAKQFQAILDMINPGGVSAGTIGGQGITWSQIANNPELAYAMASEGTGGFVVAGSASLGTYAGEAGPMALAMSNAGAAVSPALDIIAAPLMIASTLYGIWGNIAASNAYENARGRALEEQLVAIFTAYPAVVAALQNGDTQAEQAVATAIGTSPGWIASTGINQLAHYGIPEAVANAIGLDWWWQTVGKNATGQSNDSSGGGGDGGRASGGPVSAGRLYSINEPWGSGVESFVPAVNGYILNGQQTREELARGGGGGDVHIHINFSGNVYGAGGRDQFVREIAGDLNRLFYVKMSGTRGLPPYRRN